MYNIVVDTREHNLIGLLQSEDIKTRHLSIGDVIITDENDNIAVIIERKTLADLRASVFDGRYREQKKRLTDNFERKQMLYVIEGYDSFRNLDEILESTIIHSVFRDEIPILCTKNCEDTANLIRSIHTRITKNPAYFAPQKIELKCATNAALKKAKTDEDIQINLLSQIPGISTTIARELILKHGTLRCFVERCMTDEKMLDVTKINGRKLSKSVVANIKKHLL